jgi:hypothetical protein
MKAGGNLKSFIGDGSRPPGVGVQALISNYHVLLCLRDMVVSDDGKGATKTSSKC